MNAAMFALAGAALGLSIVAVSGGPGHRLGGSALVQPADQPANEAAVEALVKRYADLSVDLKARERAIGSLMADLSLKDVVSSVRSEERAEAQPAVRVSVFQPTPAADALAGRKITGEFKSVPLRDALDYVVQWSGMPGFVQWNDLEANGLVRDTEIQMDVKDIPFTAFVGLLGDAAGASTGLHPQLDYRVSDGHLEIATVSYFDHHEIELVSYDLSRLTDEVSSDALPELIMTFVDPNGWKENGGTNAELKIAGPRMFIQAPRRYHRQIEWLLGELAARPAGEGHTQATPAAPDQTLRVYPLKHIDATEAVRLVRGRHALDLGAGDVSADSHTNCLIVRSSPEQVRLVGQVLDELDRPADKTGPIGVKVEDLPLAAGSKGPPKP